MSQARASRHFGRVGSARSSSNLSLTRAAHPRPTRVPWHAAQAGGKQGRGIQLSRPLSGRVNGKCLLPAPVPGVPLRHQVARSAKYSAPPQCEGALPWTQTLS